MGWDGEAIAFAPVDECSRTIGDCEAPVCVPDNVTERLSVVCTVDPDCDRVLCNGPIPVADEVEPVLGLVTGWEGIALEVELISHLVAVEVEVTRTLCSSPSGSTTVLLVELIGGADGAAMILFAGVLVVDVPLCGIAQEVPLTGGGVVITGDLVVGSATCVDADGGARLLVLSVSLLVWLTTAGDFWLESELERELEMVTIACFEASPIFAKGFVMRSLSSSCDELEI
jgi:hypothetical protein